MNSWRRSPTGRFLRAIGNRLWTEALCALVLRAAWIAAGLLLAGGISHMVVRAHSGAGAFLLAFLIVAAALMLGVVSRRPSMAQAALTADAWFDGKALMTSAYDQVRLTPAARATAAEFVLACADEMATRCNRRLRAETRPDVFRPLSVPVVVMMVAAFLYMLPGAAPVAPAADTTAGPTAAAGARSEEAPEDARRLLAWSQPGDRASLGAVKRDSVVLPPLEGALTSEQAANFREEMDKTQGEAADTLRASDDSGSTGARAGDATPRDSTPHESEERQELATTYVDMPLPGSNAKGSAGTGLDVGRIEPSALPAWAQAAQTVDVPARTDFSPALRAYAAEYLRQISESE